MLPNILESISIEDSIVIATNNGNFVTGFEVSLFDMEIDDVSRLEQQVMSYLRDIPTQIRFRMILNMQLQYELGEKLHAQSRYEALSSLGFVQAKAFVFFEKSPSVLQEFVRSFKSIFKAKDYFKNEALKFIQELPIEGLKSIDPTIEPLDLIQYEEFFPERRVETVREFSSLIVGTRYLSVLKFIRQTTSSISIETLANIKDLLPVPFSYVVTVMNNSHLQTEERLRRKSNQAKQGQDHLSFKRYQEIQKDITETVDKGTKYLSLEVQIVLTRNSLVELQRDAQAAIERLRPLGLFYCENIGIYPSYEATIPGSEQHYPFFEMDEVVPSYVPLFTYGKCERKLQKSIRQDSLLLHRADESLDAVSIFNPAYDSFSANIIGLPGSGKSVLSNMFTRALYADPGINIVKLDVGGSHSRETQMLGGIEYEFNLGEPAGFNPFKYVRLAPKAKELVQILATFLETIIKEENEFFFSKEMKADLEVCVSLYLEAASERPNIDDFLAKTGHILPRKKLLERWSKNGVFGNAFVDTEHITKDSRLKYFNFSKVSQAMDGDFSQGGLAAVMAAFNFDMLFNRQGQRFVFIADEVPVFVQRCFSFFDLSISNIRKQGDGFVTIAQRSSHLVVNGNTSILDGSPSKFLFTVDGDESLYAKRLGLESEDLSKIKALNRIQGKFSEVFHVDPIGKRKYKIILSAEEYWSYTSKKEEKEKIQSLLEAVPGLTLKEATKCLSL